MVGQDRLTGRRLPVGAAEEEEQFTEPETQSQTDRTANYRPGERCRESCLRPPPRNLTIPAGDRQAGRTCRGFFLIALAGQHPQVSPAKAPVDPQLTWQASNVHFILSCCVYLVTFLPFCSPSGQKNSHKPGKQHFTFCTTLLLCCLCQQILQWMDQLWKVGEGGQCRRGMTVFVWFFF